MREGRVQTVDSEFNAFRCLGGLSDGRWKVEIPPSDLESLNPRLVIPQSPSSSIFKLKLTIKLTMTILAYSSRSTRLWSWA